MAVLMEDTSLDAERFLVSQWSQSNPQRVRQQLTGAWNFGCRMAGRYKIDLFVSRNRPFDRMRAKRRKIPDGFPSNFWVSSAEDMILARLEAPGDRPWRDVLVILAAQQARLSQEHLLTWAAELGVSDLLERALEQVRPLQSD